jgi:hypothetical protein
VLSRVIVSAAIIAQGALALPAWADTKVDFERRADRVFVVVRDDTTGTEFGTLDIEIAAPDSTETLSEFLRDRRTHGREIYAHAAPEGHSTSISATRRKDRRWIDFVVEDELTQDLRLHSIFARFRFSPLGKGEEPDFVFSPLLRPKDDQVIGQHIFRSPALMIQKGSLFCALLPDLDILDREWRTLPGCLDLDFLTQDGIPTLSYGLCPHELDGHVYYKSSPSITADLRAGQKLRFGFSLYCDADVTTAGALRAVVGSMWSEHGHGLYAEDVRPQVLPFDRYAEYGYGFDFEHIWREFEIDKEPCGGSVTGVLGNADSIWFQGWFNNLRTAYGMYLFGKEATSGKLIEMDLCQKARLTRNLALNAPQKGGVFPTLYNTRTGEWLGYYGAGVSREHYHTLDCSWTCYWLLRWNEDLEPDNRTIPFCERYAEFLIANQLDSGCIPSWFKMDTLEPIETFRDLNAETTCNALFLAELYRVTKEEKYLDAAKKAADFITREVIPQNKWFDYETYFSCSPKPLDFYDRHTHQWPQNDLSMHWAAEMFKTLYQATGEKGYLDLGVRMLDYLSLYQQVWCPSYLSIYGFGGFGVQNTDGEWNDARQAVFATTYLDYYELTGNKEYFERGVAAIRASFACMYIPENRNICPKTYSKQPTGYSDENYGHGGTDSPAGPSSFDWGTGSALAAAAYARHRFGDVFLDLDRGAAFGIDGIVARVSRAMGDRVSLDVFTQVSGLDTVCLKASGGALESYRISVNGRKSRVLSAEALRRGIEVVPKAEVSIIDATPKIASRLDSLYIAAEVRGLPAPVEARRVRCRVSLPNRREDLTLDMEEVEPGLFAAEVPRDLIPSGARETRYRITAYLGDDVAAESGSHSVRLVDYLFADCGDDAERYLAESEGSWISDWSPGSQLQFAGSGDRVADFDEYFVYAFPVAREAKAVKVSFEEEGECLVTVGGHVILDEGNEGRGAIRVREFELTDPEFWRDGTFSIRFADSDPSDGWGANIAWIRVEPVG